MTTLALDWGNETEELDAAVTAFDAALDDTRCKPDLAARVVARMLARGVVATWAEHEPAVHPADDRYGRGRPHRIDIQGFDANGIEVIIRVTATFLGSTVTIGAYDATGRFTASSRRADQARKIMSRPVVA